MIIRHHHLTERLELRLRIFEIAKTISFEHIDLLLNFVAKDSNLNIFIALRSYLVSHLAHCCCLHLLLSKLYVTSI